MTTDKFGHHEIAEWKFCPECGNRWDGDQFGCSSCGGTKPASRDSRILSAVPSEAIKILDAEEQYLGQCVQDSEGTIDVGFEIEAIKYCKSILQRGIAG